MLNGFGIEDAAADCFGIVYRGEYKNGMRDGYGIGREYPWKKDEYDGLWKEGEMHGEGVFKMASTGRVERRLYQRGEVKEVLEVIEEGH